MLCPKESGKPIHLAGPGLSEHGNEHRASSSYLLTCEFTVISSLQSFANAVHDTGLV